ncbi:hypothetical protein BC332_27988 [Capsicum chinense]|nr:hypothetical protein BC332_27988 [Capsicum chinense]
MSSDNQSVNMVELQSVYIGACRLDENSHNFSFSTQFRIQFSLVQRLRFLIILRLSSASAAASVVNLSNISGLIDLTYIEDKYSSFSPQYLLNVLSSLRSQKSRSNRHSDTKVPSNPRGAERLPPCLAASESDLYPRRLCGLTREDLIIKPRYLIFFAVGYEQKNNIDVALKKVRLNHYLALSPSRRSFRPWTCLSGANFIHCGERWYAKCFLHPNIVAPYDYVFIWDENLGLENFDVEEYIKLVRQHEMDISQPNVASNCELSWWMTKRRNVTRTCYEN